MTRAAGIPLFGRPAPTVGEGTAIQITVQMMLGTRKAANDSSTSLRHLRAARVLISAPRSGAGAIGEPSSGTRSVTREDTSPRVRLPYRVFSLSSYSSRVSRPSAKASPSVARTISRSASEARSARDPAAAGQDGTTPRRAPREPRPVRCRHRALSTPLSSRAYGRDATESRKRPWLGVLRSASSAHPVHAVRQPGHDRGLVG